MMAYAAAAREAQRAGLDLMSVAPGAVPPVYKLGHADAAAFEARQREKETRKKEVEYRRRNTVKEVRAAWNMPSIPPHVLLSSLCALVAWAGCCAPYQLLLAYARIAFAARYAVSRTTGTCVVQ